MKVFVAHMTSECNEHISHRMSLDDFTLRYGDECLESMHIKDIFEDEGIELIPSIYACGHPNGMILRETFDFIADKIFETLEEHLGEIDAVYLQLHGASGVVGLDCVSAEHYIVNRIREIVGAYMPIALVMDPHGNLTKKMSDQVNIVRCYRESPHSDQIDTERLVAKKLIELMRDRRPMRPVMRKLPIMVGGERSVSANEPMLTINAMLDEAEKDERVFSDSYHVGYIRHDDDKLGAAVVVVPNQPEDRDYCEEVADRIARYAWDHREEFKFSGNFDEPEESVKRALAFDGKTAVITDSGDNCGAGGAGQNTRLLRIMLGQDTGTKKILFAGINDPASHKKLEGCKIGDHVSLDLGTGETEESAPVHIEGTVAQIGEEMYGLGANRVVGPAYTIKIDGTSIYVLVMDHNIQYGMMEQFQKAGLDFHDYDIVIVKMGYLDTFLIPETAYHIMALTDGPTVQRSEQIPFRKIYRPMWPIDDFPEMRYIEQS